MHLTVFSLALLLERVILVFMGPLAFSKPCLYSKILNEDFRGLNLVNCVHKRDSPLFQKERTQKCANFPYIALYSSSFD